MRLLLAVCLCFTSTTLAVGDENFKRVEDPIDDLQTPDAPISAPVPDPIADRPLNQPTEAAVDDLGGDAPRFEEGRKAEATEWHPRLAIVLHTKDYAPQIKFPVIKDKIPEFKSPIASSPVNEDFTTTSPPSDLPESGESAKYITAFRFRPGDYFSLYCDAVTLNILQEGNTPTYQLECKSRIHISTEGFSVDADSASFKEGKCELVNARFNNGVVSATATQLTLALPIYAVSTRNFGRPIPKSPPTENEVTPSPADRHTFHRDIGQ